MDLLTTKMLREVVPLVTVLAIVLIVLSLAAILYLGEEVFVPIALSILLSFVLAPPVRYLQRARFPRVLAVVCVVVSAFAGLLLLGSVLIGQLTDLAGQLPRYRETIDGKMAVFRNAASTNGTLSRAMQAIGGMASDFEHSVMERGTGDATGRPADDHRVVVTIDRPSSGTLRSIGGYLSPVLHPLATAGIVLIFTIFVLLRREDLRNRFIRLAGTDDLQRTTAAIDDAGRRLSRFLLSQTAVNVIYGTTVAIGLGLIGIPTPVLWGIFAGVCRFVPYVGAAMSAIVPLGLAVAVDPGWTMLLWTGALFLGVDLLLGQVVEPILYGHSTGLSPVAVILAATVWTFLWGPIGLVLATPLTVCLVVLGRYVARLKFLDIMLGDRPALSPPQIFYQRMLARDPTETVQQAREFLRERALSTYYDEVALEGLRLAQEDVARGALSAERERTLYESTKDVVRRLASIVERPAARGPIGAEAAAAVDAAGPDSAVATMVLRPADLKPEWRGETPVLCVAGNGLLDECVALMLAQIFDRHGIKTRVVGADVLTGTSALPMPPSGVAMVCFSFMDPLSTLHLRYASRRVRRNYPKARVMIGVWRRRDPAMADMLLRASRADALVTSLLTALAAAVAAASQAQPASVAPAGIRALDPEPELA